MIRDIDSPSGNVAAASRMRSRSDLFFFCAFSSDASLGVERVIVPRSLEKEANAHEVS